MLIFFLTYFEKFLNIIFQFFLISFNMKRCDKHLVAASLKKSGTSDFSFLITILLNFPLLSSNEFKYIKINTLFISETIQTL